MSLRPVYLSPGWDSLETQHKNIRKIYLWVPPWERLGEGLAQQTEVQMCTHSQRNFMPPCCRASGQFASVLGMVVVILWPNSNILWLTISNAMERLRMNVWIRGKLSVDATVAAPVLQSGLNVTADVPWVVTLWIFKKALQRQKPLSITWY